MSVDGIALVDKVEGMTSFGVVKALRRILNVKKAGHTGTLDPLATGVLPICVGEATKVAGMLLADRKTYLATGLFGRTTDSLDVTGEILSEKDVPEISAAQFEGILEDFRGEIEQIPPAFSAIKVDGQRAYAKARRGEEVKLKPRRVVIHRLTVLKLELPYFEIEVDCSKGTYIRSLVADIGERFGCGATLSALRRLQSSGFSVDRCVTLAELEASPDTHELLSVDEAVGYLPHVQITENDEVQIRHGQPVELPAETLASLSGDQATEEPQLIRIRQGECLVALGVIRDGGLWPKRVFAAS
jgi:tRNA pseudouridine55 synthase